jgi:4-methylaminobutanoate oxidase (formaldehyde-forming)
MRKQALHGLENDGAACGWCENRWIQAAGNHGAELWHGMHLLTPAEEKKMWPLLNIDDLVGASFLPTDDRLRLPTLRIACQGCAHACESLLRSARVTSFDIRMAA